MAEPIHLSQLVDQAIQAIREKLDAESTEKLDSFSLWKATEVATASMPRDSINTILGPPCHVPRTVLAYCMRTIDMNSLSEFGVLKACVQARVVSKLIDASRGDFGRELATAGWCVDERDGTLSPLDTYP